MKNSRIFIGVVVLALFLVSCKASKCDCPSFKSKKRGDILNIQPQFDTNTATLKA